MLAQAVIHSISRIVEKAQVGVVEMNSVTPSGWYRRVLSLSWPVILANLTVPLVGIADTAVVGRLPDSSYMGGVAIGAASFSAFYWIFGFLRMVTTGLVAQSYGAKQIDEVVVVGVRSGVIAAGIGMLFVALSVPIYQLTAHIFDASALVEAKAANYFFVRIWGAPALLMHFVELGVLFGLQRMRAVLAVTLGFHGLNAALDVLFVYGFGLGVGGVALGTAISEWSAALLGGYLVVKALGELGWFFQRTVGLGNRSKLLSFGGLSGNMMLRTLFVQIPFLGVTALGARMGDLVLAANLLLMQYFYLMSYTLDGFAQAAESLAGEAFGAKDRFGLRAITKYSTICGAGLAIVIAGCYGAFTPWMIDAMTDLPDVRRTAREFAPWIVCMPLVAIWAFQMDGIYIGTTQIRSLRNNMFVALVSYLTIAVWAVPTLGNHGMWLALTGFMMVRSATLLLGYPRIERQIPINGEPKV